MKCRRKHLRTVLCAAAIVLGTVFAAAPKSVHAAGNTPVQNGTVYNAIKHFLSHVAKRDQYTFYDKIPCTHELRECIGYLLDAYQLQGVDFISRFDLHWSPSYPYANVRNFCAHLDKEFKSGSTVKVPCGSSQYTFLFKKYKTADAAYADGAFDTAGTIGLLTSPNETYGHCWISLGKFPSMSANEMRLWLEKYYGLSSGSLSGTIATGDVNKVWKGYSRNVWRVHATRWSEDVHGGCIVDNGSAEGALQNAPCYVLIPTSENNQQAAQPTQPSQPSQPTQPAQPVQADQGSLSVQLISAMPALTGGNANYSLSGVKIGVYTDAACTRELLSAATDANGCVKFNYLWVQTVYVKLQSDAPGYRGASVRSVQITKNNTAELVFALTPQMISPKISVQPQVYTPSLDGAEFTVRFYACTGTDQLADAVPKGVWMVTAGKDGAVFGGETTTVVQAPAGTPGYYRDADGGIVFPLGLITIEQTGAAEGQVLDRTWAVCGCTGSGITAEAAASAQHGSHAPVIYFTSAYQSLQSLVSDGTTSYLVTAAPAGSDPDSMRTLNVVPSEKQNSGLWFVTGSKRSAEQLVDPVVSSRLFSAGGNAKPDGALLQTGDIVCLYDRAGESCFEGTVFLSGDQADGGGALHMSDLVRIRSSLSDRLQNGLYSEADGSIRVPDPISIRKPLPGSGSVFQVP